MVPVLEYRQEGKALEYRYQNIVKDFDMPVKVKIGGKEQWVFPKADWTSHPEAVGRNAEFEVDRNFYINATKR